MVWQLKFGQHQAQLEALRKRRGEVPSAFENKPELYEDSVPYWTAFLNLSVSRLFNEMGPMPLAVSDIEAYLNIYGVCDIDRRIAYYEAVVALDNQWLKFQRENNKPNDRK